VPLDSRSCGRIEVEWGTCVGTAFGVRREAALIVTDAVGADMSYVAEVQGIDRVCVRAFAYNENGAKSLPSNVAYKDLLPVPGKPVTLEQPIILEFNQE
jgi:hypothetical protein